MSDREENSDSHLEVTCDALDDDDFIDEYIAADEDLGEEIHVTDDEPKEKKEEEKNTEEYPCSPAPPVEIKLFLARIPKSYEESEIKKMFEEFGKVKEVAVIRDKNTNAHKCCAFVRMCSISQADAAIRSLNNQCVVDTALGSVQIKYAVGETDRLGFTSLVGEAGCNDAKLFVGSLPKTVDEAAIREIFKDYGTLDDVYIMKDQAGNGKGCAFVKMAYKEQGLFAIRSLNGKITLEGCTRPLEVRFAESKAQAQKAQAKQQPPMAPAATNYAPGYGPGYGPGGGYGPGYGHGPGGQYGGYGPGYGHGPNGQYGGYGPGYGHGGYGPSGQYGPTPGAPMGGYGPGNYGGPNYVPNNNNPRKIGPWKEYVSPEGRPYFYNEHTGHTQWERPPEFQNAPLPGVSGPNHHGGPNNGNQGGNTMTSGPPGSNLFIFHIPNEWTYNDLVRSFSQFGRVISARIATDKATGRHKGYAFVSYDNPDSASQAVANMNGFTVLGKRLKVTVKKGDEGSQTKFPLPPSQHGRSAPY